MPVLFNGGHICGAILFIAAYPFVPAIQQFMLGPSLSEMVLSIVLFLIIFAVLGRIVPRSLNVIAKRSNAVEGSLANAEETQGEARRLFEKCRTTISEAQLEAAYIRAEAREHGARIAAEVRDRALMDARRIVENAAAEIQESRISAFAEVHPQVAEIAVKLSGRILGEPPDERSSPVPHLHLFLRTIRGDRIANGLTARLNADRLAARVWQDAVDR